MDLILVWKTPREDEKGGEFVVLHLSNNNGTIYGRKNAFSDKKKLFKTVVEYLDRKFKF